MGIGSERYPALFLLDLGGNQENQPEVGWLQYCMYNKQVHLDTDGVMAQQKSREIQIYNLRNQGYDNFFVSIDFWANTFTIQYPKCRLYTTRKAIQIRQISAFEEAATQSFSKNLTMQSKRIVSRCMSGNKPIFKEAKAGHAAIFLLHLSAHPHPLPSSFKQLHQTGFTTWVPQKSIIIGERAALSRRSQR